MNYFILVFEMINYVKIVLGCLLQNLELMIIKKKILGLCSGFPFMPFNLQVPFILISLLILFPCSIFCFLLALNCYISCIHAFTISMIYE